MPNLICACGATFTDWKTAHQHMVDNLGKGGTHRLEHAEPA